MYRLLLLIFTIKFAIFTILPVMAASGSGSTCQTTIKVMLNNRPGQIQISTNHGETPVGVVGIKIDERLGGAIIEEYPPSNLWKTFVRPGDRVFAVEGQMVDFYRFEDQCRGAVGQIRHLTIIHNGQVLNLNVPLIDSRRLVQYNPGFQQSASMTVQW